MMKKKIKIIILVIVFSFLAYAAWFLFIVFSTGNISTYNNKRKSVQLTKNITMYNVFVDPKFVSPEKKQRFIDIITPLVYEHLCRLNGIHLVTPEECVQNVENFIKKPLLPKKPEAFYYGSGVTSNIDVFDLSGFVQKRNDIIANFSSGVAYQLIKYRLDQNIFIGILHQNYVGFFVNENFLKDLRNANFPFVEIKYNNYVYIIPDKVDNMEKDVTDFKAILDKYGYTDNYIRILHRFKPQENRYVRILSNVNPYVAKMVKDLKLEYYRERTSTNIPILHGLGLEQNNVM